MIGINNGIGRGVDFELVVWAATVMFGTSIIIISHLIENWVVFSRSLSFGNYVFTDAWKSRRSCEAHWSHRFIPSLTIPSNQSTNSVSRRSCTATINRYNDERRPGWWCFFFVVNFFLYVAEHFNAPSFPPPSSPQKFVHSVLYTVLHI